MTNQKPDKGTTKGGRMAYASSHFHIDLPTPTPLTTNEELEKKIKAWYKDLDEITLPNLDSEDGSHMNINLWELRDFIDQQTKEAEVKALDKAIATVKRNPDKALDILWKMRATLTNERERK